MREALEAIYAALDNLDNRVRKCEEECRLEWKADNDRIATLDLLADVQLAIHKLYEQPPIDGGGVMREDDKPARDMSLEARIKRAREANLALYMDEPTPEAAQFLVVFEQVVLQLRGQEKRRREQMEGGA